MLQFSFILFILYLCFIFVLYIFSSCFIYSIKWFIGYVGPKSFTEMVNFIFSCKFSRGGRGEARENLKNKLKLTISLPQGPLKEPFIHIYMSDIFTCPTYIHVHHLYMSNIYRLYTIHIYVKKHSDVKKMDLLMASWHIYRLKID